MKASRELDALVAEKLMGWKFSGAFTTDPELGSDRWATDQNGCERYFSEVPHYSTSIAAAWELLEKGFVEAVVKLTDGRWHARHSSVTLDDEFNLKLDCGHNMSFGEDYYEIPIYSNGIIADTAAHAICLAALVTAEELKKLT